MIRRSRRSRRSRRARRCAPLLASLTAFALASCGKQAEPPKPPESQEPSPESTPEPEVSCSYIVLIDAGSSGTRAYTYEIESKEGGLPSLSERSSHKIDAALASFKTEPARAGDAISELLKAEGSSLAALPDECEAKTPAALMATGGMRLLEGEVGGADAAKAIYKAAGDAIAAAGLEPRFAGTISGEQEALYGWLTINYALGTLAGDGPTAGALDLGGSSTQVAFVPSDAGDAPTTTLTLAGKQFAVYAHSYLNYGLSQAMQYVADPSCYPKGVNKGKGRYASCVKKLAPVVTPKKCEAKHCGLATPGDAKNKLGVPQPPLPEGMEFHATGNFYYAHKFVKAAGDTPGALAEAAGGPKGKSGFCGEKWEEITAQQDVEPKLLERACFAAAWSSVLLETYGFARDAATLRWSETVGERDTSWTLGAALCSITGCLAAK
ncbi:MAG: hypothetical protein H6713_28875 [Myxococcales bacterium]|nr:hypothetical protein [Myxococcales bacterium]